MRWGLEIKKIGWGEIEIGVVSFFSIASTFPTPPLPSPPLLSLSRPRENYPIIEKVCLSLRGQLVDDAGATSAKFGAGPADHCIYQFFGSGVRSKPIYPNGPVSDGGTI